MDGADRVFFYDIQADGFSLDDKRQPIKGNDLPDCLKQWRDRDLVQGLDRAAKMFFVAADEIRAEEYSLSITQYKQHSYEEEKHDPPEVILERMRLLNDEIAVGLGEIKALLR